MPSERSFCCSQMSRRMTLVNGITRDHIQSFFMCSSKMMGLLVWNAVKMELKEKMCTGYNNYTVHTFKSWCQETTCRYVHLIVTLVCSLLSNPNKSTWNRFYFLHRCQWQSSSLLFPVLPHPTRFCANSSKSNRPFYPTLPSTLASIRSECKTKGPKQAVACVSAAMGGMAGAESPYLEMRNKLQTSTNHWDMKSALLDWLLTQPMSSLS